MVTKILNFKKNVYLCSELSFRTKTPFTVVKQGRKHSIKKILTVVCFLIATNSAIVHAQNMIVESITENVNDVVGKAYTRLDLNDQPCAILKFSMPATITRIEGNYIGEPIQKDGEQWVYVTNGTNRIDITAEGFLPLSINFPKFGIRRVKGGIVYRIKLSEKDEGADMTNEELYALALANYRAGDYASALKWALKATEKGVGSAYPMVGDIYENGRGVKKDTKKAFEYYRQGARLGDAISQLTLADAYMDGRVVLADTLEAFKWFQRAAEQKFPDASACLAEFYEKGKYTEKNDIKAAELALSSAKAGSIYGMLFATRYLELGIGIERDHEEALSWLRKAVANGNKKARKLLRKMTDEEFKGTYVTKKTFQQLWEETDKELEEEDKSSESEQLQ